MSSLTQLIIKIHDDYDMGDVCDYLQQRNKVTTHIICTGIKCTNCPFGASSLIRGMHEAFGSDPDVPTGEC